MRRRRAIRAWVATAVVAASSALTGAFAEPPAAARAGSVQIIVAAAGDIACRPGIPATPTTCRQRGTANLIGQLHPAVVLALGDLVYPAGTQPGFDHSYAPSWGRYRAITHPVPGNHEYGTPGASGYFGYFGARATPLQPGCRIRCKGYYSYAIGSWHVVALNTDCSEHTGVCIGLDAETDWLRHDLTTHPRACTLAYMHNPLFSGGFGSTPAVRGLWRVLQAHHADLVVTGHAHNYQRFVAQMPDGTASATGITELIAGTGGHSMETLTTARNQAAHVNHAFGLLRLVLDTDRWTSSFVTLRGFVLDRSGGRCH